MDARDIIALRGSERSEQANFRNLYQDVANYICPRQNQITTQQTPGRNRFTTLYDTTAVHDAKEMASGLVSTSIPTGQFFFGLTVTDPTPLADAYLHEATEIAHERMFESNFMTQINETLLGLIVFGTGCIFSEAVGTALNYRDYDISFFQILENHAGMVDTILVTFQLTARQAVEKFVDVGEKVAAAAKDERTKNRKFEFIHYVGPRSDRDPTKLDQLNTPFESIYVSVQDASIVRTGGYREFPYAVARWMKSSHEKYGRGQGTEVVDDVRALQQMKKDFISLGNKFANPPLQIPGDFQGIVDLRPGAQNYVAGGEIRPIGAVGNFPITKDMLEFQQEIIHKAFYRDVFTQLAGLSGDRRTTTEIVERIREGLRRMAVPLYRLQSELLTPLVTRSVLLLIRNGVIPYPPPELQGARFGIEFLGEMSLALRNQQVRAFDELVARGAKLESVFPGITDNLDFDGAFRRIGVKLGVHSRDIRPFDEVQRIRRQREQALAAQQTAQMAAMAADGYTKTTKKPEDGSLAQEVLSG